MPVSWISAGIYRHFDSLFSRQLVKQLASATRVSVMQTKVIRSWAVTKLGWLFRMSLPQLCQWEGSLLSVLTLPGRLLLQGSNFVERRLKLGVKTLIFLLRSVGTVLASSDTTVSFFITTPSELCFSDCSNSASQWGKNQQGFGLLSSFLSLCILQDTVVDCSLDSYSKAYEVPLLLVVQSLFLHAAYRYVGSVW